MLSVGIAVDPNNATIFNKNLKIGLDYRVTMAEVTIVVSDSDTDAKGIRPSPESGFGSSISFRDNPLEGNGIGNGDNKDTPPPNLNSLETPASLSPESITSSRTTRPSCHRTREESQRTQQLQQLELLETRRTSNIPYILGAGTLKPCSYYRQKLNNNGTPEANYWVNASALQKSAGQKVIQRLNEQQRHLAAEAAAMKQRTRKNMNSFGSLLFSCAPEEEDEYLHQRPDLLRMKKRPRRLEPLQLNQKVLAS